MTEVAVTHCGFSAGASAPPQPPQNNGVPQISDTTPTEGQTLTTTNGTWTNSPSSFKYAWSCSPSPCTNATTGSSYVVAHGDIGKTIGHLLRDELELSCDIVSIDGVDLRDFDFVDLGEMVTPPGVIPLVIKSLIFR